VRRLAVLLACLAAVALLAACGGTSKEDYRAEAKTICVDADRATERVRQPTRTTPAAIADYFTRLLEPAKRATGRFEALEPPDDLAEQHEQVVRANRASIREVEQLVVRLKRGGDARQVLAGAQDRIRTLTREADAAAKRLGVPECGQ
jgi:hypothetical protein